MTMAVAGHYKHTLHGALFIALLVGCGKTQQLEGLNTTQSVSPEAQIDAHFCTVAPPAALTQTKYLFILDHSASNQPGFPLVPGDVSNTDATGSRRYGPMIQFVQSLIDNPDPNNATAYGLIDFNSDIIPIDGNLSGFDASGADFITQATQDWQGKSAPFRAPLDSGFTNYVTALNFALQMITDDATAAAGTASAQVVTNYRIVFVSDGAPVIANPDGSSSTITQTLTDVTVPIQALMALPANADLGQYINSITLNTAYYYNGSQAPDPHAQQLLQQMATQLGNGQYLEFGSGSNILYQQFAPPVLNLQSELANVLVDNTNAIWWDDGRFLADTDGDGLPDVIEQQYGSDPTVVDTDGNGVSDLVEYRTKGQPCKDPLCAPQNRDTYSVCDGLSPARIPPTTLFPNGRISYPSTSNDGLNDCEKYVLSANRYLFNTNGDLIPDFIALKNNLPLIFGSAAQALADPFGDGLTNEVKIKLGLPTQVSLRSLSSSTERSETLEQEASAAPGSSCYHLQVAHIATLSSTDVLRVMVVLNSSVVQNKPFLIQAFKAVDPTAATAAFVAGDFK